MKKLVLTAAILMGFVMGTYAQNSLFEGRQTKSGLFSRGTFEEKMEATDDFGALWLPNHNINGNWDADEQPEEAEPDLRLTGGPVRFLLEKGVTSDKAKQVVSIVEESPNMRVAYNELRKAFGNKGARYLNLMKEYKRIPQDE